MNLSNSRQIGLDELPAYSDWVSYLLGLKTLTRNLDKSAESIQREYGKEKWGSLLEKLRLLDHPMILDADCLSVGESKEVPFYADGALAVAELEAVQQAYFELIRDTLQSHVKKAGHLVELGAGYGSLLLKLAGLPDFERIGYTAGEYTESGIACIKLLASNMKIQLQTGYCDLSDLSLQAFSIPKNAVFLTSWTMACLKGFSRSTLQEIIRHRPAVVVHVEPIYEHWSEDSLMQMLWKRYCQLNDYNMSMLTALRAYEAEGLIKIVEERNNLFGNNPLAPVSIIKWIPCD